MVYIRQFGNHLLKLRRYTSIAYDRDGRLYACGAGPKSLVEINLGEGTVFKIFENYANVGDYLVRIRMSDQGWFVLPDGRDVKFWQVDKLHV